jgi:prolyl-tRNA synthetase
VTGYAIWEAIQRALDERIKATGHENLSFPLFAPFCVVLKSARAARAIPPLWGFVRRRVVGD